MKKQITPEKPPHPLRWFLPLPFLLLAIVILLELPMYRFSALICAAIAAVLAAFPLLCLLGRAHPGCARVLKALLCSVLIVGILICTVTGAVVLRASSGNPETACDYIVVLGAAVYGSVPSLTLSERINAAYSYLQAHPGTTCIVSGGQGGGETITEALCMYRALTNRGIESSRIWMEDRATSTHENLKFALQLIGERTGSRPETLGIVSSEYHLFRAGLFAAAQDIDAIGIPARTTQLPLRINYTLREIAGVWHYFILGGRYHD